MRDHCVVAVYERSLYGGWIFNQSSVMKSTHKLATVKVVFCDYVLYKSPVFAQIILHRFHALQLISS